MMRSLIAIAALVTSVSAIAQTQVPNVFEDGTPASAAEVNENFQYVLENASGGCSATQQDNSVVIECADGTSGVIAGAGTVALPSGFTGEADLSQLNSGDIVLVDGNDIVLAQYKGRYSDSGYVFSLLGNTDSPGPYEARLNNTPSNSVELLHYPLIDGWANGYSLFFLGADDCNDPSATVFSGRNAQQGEEASAFKEIIMAPNGKYYVHTGEKLGQTLFSTAYVHEWREGDGGWQWACQQGEFINSPGVLVEFTFPPEILNAAYPVRLEQLP